MSAIHFHQDIDDQHWQNYRTWFGEHVAVVSVNTAVLASFSEARPINIAQISRHYESDQNGLPSEPHYHDMFRQILHTITQLCALPDVFYAGHILSNGKAQQFFYFNDEISLLETLGQLTYDALDIQQDPQWDTYFEFLLPSSLESKMMLTEEMLDTLSESGVDLSISQRIEHNFHFDEKEDIEQFIEKCSLSQVPFERIKYTERAVKVEDEQWVYLVKVEQEMALDTQAIFSQVEQFELLAEEFSARYLGWECSDLGQQGYYVN
ncbi:TIGR01619 family protein [Lonepinella sp. BR2271]|uniref:TIGR01619 family protein n=1 Tax=Lonepinella sp. BR2271 TaxID=3434550 RepID=UPI003F6E2F38